jgi:hypothetical protein
MDLRWLIGLLVLLAIAAAKGAGTEFGKDIYNFIKTVLVRTRQKIVTKDIIEHRIQLRQGLKEKLLSLDYREREIEVLISDANRGGITYGENKRFFWFKKWLFQKAYVIEYYDKELHVGWGSLILIKFDKTKQKWVEADSGDKNTQKAYTVGVMSYDNVVAIDWEPSKSDGTPTIYYSCPLTKMFERQYYAKHIRGREYEELGPV